MERVNDATAIAAPPRAGREGPVRGFTPPRIHTGGEGNKVTRGLADQPVWMPVHSVLICDARPGIRAILTRMVGHIRTAAEVVFVDDGCALSAAYAAKQADLVFIGLQSGAPGGTGAASQLLAQNPSAHVIVYGSVRDAALLAAAVAGGARGLLLWRADEQNEPSMPNQSRPQRQLVPTRLAAGAAFPMTDAWPDPPTERELQILLGMARGLTNREIGRELFLSVDTVKTHASRLFRRLGAHDRGHAVALGMRGGLVA